jgi:arylsulfatase A
MDKCRRVKLGLLWCISEKLFVYAPVRKPSFGDCNAIEHIVRETIEAGHSCYGSSFYESPTIDQLTKDGMRFTDAYTAGTVCSPTRAI